MPDPLDCHSQPDGCDDTGSQPSRSQLRRIAVQTATGENERCHCPRDGLACPHCGRPGNAGHRDRCHHAATGTGPATPALAVKP